MNLQMLKTLRSQDLEEAGLESRILNRIAELKDIRKSLLQDIEEVERLRGESKGVVSEWVFNVEPTRAMLVLVDEAILRLNVQVYMDNKG